MSNPFYTIDLRSARSRRSRASSPNFAVEQCIQSIDVSTPRGIRDRVVLLLRHKYMLRPSEIARLNVGDVDLAGGVIRIRSRRNPLIIVADSDVPHIRRWCSIRHLYAGDEEGLIISLHWTDGRSLLHQRIGVRGLFQIVKKYAEQKNQDGGRTKQLRMPSRDQRGVYPCHAADRRRAGARRTIGRPN